MHAFLARSVAGGVALLLASTVACAAATAVVAAYPHDPNAFTQGLLYDHDALFESTGLYKHSTLRRVDLASGDIQASVALKKKYFGEGLALAHGRLYQLTWKAGVVFVYDRKSLKRIGRFFYHGQGWGLTWDGHHLIMSDGSSTLRVIDARGFSEVRRIQVRENGKPVPRLNELEYINDEIWANIWRADRIVRIDPASGEVIGDIDAGNLRAALPTGNHAGALNGIAWDAAHCRLFVTGKNWPRLFRIAPTALAAEPADGAHCKSDVTHN